MIHCTVSLFYVSLALDLIRITAFLVSSSGMEGVRKKNAVEEFKLHSEFYKGLSTKDVKGALQLNEQGVNHKLSENPDYYVLLARTKQWASKFSLRVSEDNWDLGLKIEAACEHAAYTMPFFPLVSKQMELHSCFSLWFMCLEQELFSLSSSKDKDQIETEIRVFEMQMCKVLKNSKEVDGEIYLRFHYLLQMISDIHEMCKSVVHDWTTCSSHLASEVSRALDVLMWLLWKSDGNEDKLIDLGVDMWAFVHSTHFVYISFARMQLNRNVGVEVLEHPCFKVIDRLPSVATLIQYILCSDSAANKVLGRLKEKGKLSVEEAIKLVRVAETEYLLAKEMLLKLFYNESKLPDWFKIGEAYVTGTLTMVKFGSTIKNET